MKKYLKAVALIASAILIVSSLAGCGQKTSTTDDVTTIEWLGYQPLAEPDTNSPLVKAVEEKYGVDIQFWYIDNSKYEEILGVKLASGEMPDIFRLPNLGGLGKFVQQGIAAEITDEMLAKAPAYTESIKKHDEAGDTWIDARIDGKLYALKNQNLNGSYATTLAWRTDWLKNVGIDKIPETLDEWEEAIYKFTFEDPDGNGVKDTYGMSETTFSAVFGAFGAIPINRFNLSGGIDTFNTVVDGKVTFAAIQPEMKEALKILNKWYKDGVIDPEFITGENTGGYWAVSQAFENGKVGVTGNAMIYHWAPPLYEGHSGGAVYKSFMTVNPDAKFGETFDLGKAPLGPTGKSGVQTWGAVNNGGQVITAKAAKDENKIDFIFGLLNDYYADPEVAALLKYGIEGETYTISADGTYTILPEFAASDASSRAGLNVLAVSGDYDPGFVKTWDPKLYEFMDKYKGTGYANARAPQVDAKVKYISDIHRFTVESYMKMITGERPLEYFEEYVSKVLEMGGQQIIDETNAAIN
jgi:putative aldouronate transport system substrate-binding protein